MDKYNLPGLLVAAGTPVRESLLQALAQGCHPVVAVDGGYRYCQKAGILPDLLLGDMDSLGEIPGEAKMEILRLPCEKDDTDTLFAMRELVRRGCREIVVTCALGGRLDHTIANIHALCYLRLQGISAEIRDDRSSCQVLLPGEYTLQKDRYDTFSLFPLGEACEGVTLRQAKYPLAGYRLTNTFPIGVSNEFLCGDAQLSFQTGKMLVIRCHAADEPKGSA